ncbi:MAG: DUF2505 domain-containing protein [Actinomycetota bacterium]
MEFEISHSFDATPDEVAAAILDEEYQHSLSHVGQLKERELLEQRTNGAGRVVRRVRCVLDIDLPGTAKRFIGEEAPAWVEEATWHEDRMQWDFVIEPEIAGELLDARGTIGIKPEGEGTVRTVRGKVKMRVPFYGGRVEDWIVKGMSDAYDEEAGRLEAWLSSRASGLRSP